jgi:hypothetical protein
MGHKGALRRLTQLGGVCIFVVAICLSGPHDIARAGFKSVSDCQGSGDPNSGPGLAARIDCYNDVMGAIGFQREMAQHLSDMIKAIQGTLAGDAGTTCLSKPYDRIIASANGGHCSAQWNQYRTHLVELESLGCRNKWMPLSDEARSVMPKADQAKLDYEACFEAALLDGRVAPEQIKLYQIRSRDHFKELYARVVGEWKTSASENISLFHDHLEACKADSELLKKFPESVPTGIIVCGSK